MFDWNGNDRNDWGDSYIEYEMLNETYEKDEQNHKKKGNHRDADECPTGVILFVLGFIIWVIWML